MGALQVKHGRSLNPGLKRNLVACRQRPRAWFSDKSQRLAGPLPRRHSPAAKTRHCSTQPSDDVGMGSDCIREKLLQMSMKKLHFAVSFFLAIFRGSVNSATADATCSPRRAEHYCKIIDFSFQPRIPSCTQRNPAADKWLASSSAGGSERGRGLIPRCESRSSMHVLSRARPHFRRTAVSR